MLTILKLGVAASGLFCAVVLMVVLIRTFAFGQKPAYSRSRGSSFAGVMYAFGWGMLPWEKESATKHIWTYLGGILYHVGILIAMLFLVLVLFGISLPLTWLQPVRIFLVIGTISGVALLIKRILKPHLRSLSSVDDYWANFLVDLFILLALISTYAEKALIPFLIIAIITFIYIPFGKLRHCVFFFYSRIIFGAFFGKRGVLPHSSRKA
jgi:nitrate reductase gamma subunit